MLFKPFGVKSGQVVDPDVLANEFQEASRVINETTWWQWANAAFTDTQDLASSAGSAAGLQPDAVVHVERNGKSALTQSNHDFEPVLLSNQVRGATSSTTATTLDPDDGIYQIAYNRGLLKVDDTSVTWTSKYAELLFVAFSFQYVRVSICADLMDPNYSTHPTGIVELFPNNDGRIRTQIRIRIDDGDLPGCGPYVLPVDGKNRGTGVGAKSAAPVIVGIALVPAGTHTVYAAAGQKPASLQQNEDDADADSKIGLDETTASGVAADAALDEGVCIGSRRMMVIRFPRGNLMSP